MLKMDGIEDVIWIQTSFLGDIVLTTAAMKLLSELNPNCRQRIVTTNIGKVALEDESYLSSRHVLDKKKTHVLKSFRELRDSLVSAGTNLDRSIILQAHRSFRSTLLSQYLKAPVITYKETIGSVLAPYLVPRIGLWHEVSRIAMLLEPLGVSRQNILDVKPTLAKSTDPWPGRSEALEKKIIALAPGSKWATKMWPIENFVALAERISRRDDCYVVVLGSGAEKSLGDAVCTPLATRKNVENLCGRTSLGQLRSLYPNLTLLVSGDSSPIHYASAFNIPTIAIFGATVSQMGFSPLAEESIVIEESGLSCRPCSDHGPKTCPLSHFRCMKNIAVERVLQIVEEKLEKHS